MARYRASVDTKRSRDYVFGFLSDFANTQEWDPGVVEAERPSGEAVGQGTRFHLVAQIMGRKARITYRIVEYDPPHAVTFLGENATLVSRDRITFEAFGAGTHITYDAELKLKGPLRVAAAAARVQPGR